MRGTLVAVCVAAALVAAAVAQDKPAEATKPAEVAKPAPCYVCGHCKTAEAAAGKCKCGVDLKAMNCISVKDGKALVCSCEAGCKCTVKEGDTKCSCGKDVIAVKCLAGAACPAAKAVEAPVQGGCHCK
jgi:hypothetical protein